MGSCQSDVHTTTTNSDSVSSKRTNSNKHNKKDKNGKHSKGNVVITKQGSRTTSYMKRTPPSTLQKEPRDHHLVETDIDYMSGKPDNNTEATTSCKVTVPDGDGRDVVYDKSTTTFMRGLCQRFDVDEDTLTFLKHCEGFLAHDLLVNLPRYNGPHMVRIVVVHAPASSTLVVTGPETAKTAVECVYRPLLVSQFSRTEFDNWPSSEHSCD